MEQLKRERVAVLLRAGHPIPKIAELVGVSQVTVYAIRKRLEAREPISRRPGSGGKPSPRLNEVRAEVAEVVGTAVVKTTRGWARDKGIAESSLRRILKEQGIANRARTQRCALTTRHIELRLSRGQALLNQLKRGNRVILFSDEKLFD
jgi:transposase